MIHLANNYYLDADKYTFLIKERVVYKTGKHKGEEAFENIEYHSSFKRCFEAVNELLARDGINYRWDKIHVSGAYKALNRALQKVTSPDFTKSFFSMKKELAKND